jgi:hypothetical protein
MWRLPDLANLASVLYQPRHCSSDPKPVQTAAQMSENLVQNVRSKLCVERFIASVLIFRDYLRFTYFRRARKSDPKCGL